MCASKRFGKFAVLFLFLLTCLGSSIPVSAEAEEEPEVLTAIASADVFFSGFLIAEGDTLELEESQYYLEDAVSYLIAYNENGGEALLLAEISGWETVDIQTAGSYTVTVHLCIDDSDRDAANYVLAPELENISIPVCISQPEAFDLFCARTTAESHVIYCLPELHEGDSVYAYSSEQPCDDAELDDCTWTLCDNEMASICQNGFFIHRNRLPEKWYTYFYVQTEDIRSQYIGIFEDGSHTKVISIGGDRDGSDNVASPTPAVSQPAPAAPEAAPTETRSTASTTTQTQAAQIKAPAAVPAAAEENDNAGSPREEHKKRHILSTAPLRKLLLPRPQLLLPLPKPAPPRARQLLRLPCWNTRTAIGIPFPDTGCSACSNKAAMRYSPKTALLFPFRREHSPIPTPTPSLFRSRQKRTATTPYKSP